MTMVLINDNISKHAKIKPDYRRLKCNLISEVLIYTN